MKKIGLFFFLLQFTLLSAWPTNTLNIYIPLVTNKTNKAYILQIGENKFTIPAKRQRRFLRFPIKIEKISSILHQQPIQIYTDSETQHAIIAIDFFLQRGKHYVIATMLRNNKVITSTKRQGKLFYDKIDLYITLDGNNLEKSSLNLKKRAS